MWTQNTGIVSSNPARVPIKTPLLRKATGNHFIKSISLEKFRAVFLFSDMLEIEYATQLLLAISFIGNDFLNLHQYRVERSNLNLVGKMDYNCDDA